jgi:hypothetical protein
MKLNSNKEIIPMKKTYFFLNLFYYPFLLGNIITIIFFAFVTIKGRFNIDNVEVFMPDTNSSSAVINNITYNLHSLSGRMTISGVSLVMSVIFNLPHLILSIGVLYIAINLKKILKSIITKNVFQKANETRIKKIGLTIIIIPIIITLKEYLVYPWLPTNLKTCGLGIAETYIFATSYRFKLFDFIIKGGMDNLVYIALGFVIIFIGNVFKEGNSLKEENKLTI